MSTIEDVMPGKAGIERRVSMSLFLGLTYTREDKTEIVALTIVRTLRVDGSRGGGLTYRRLADVDRK